MRNYNFKPLKRLEDVKPNTLYKLGTDKRWLIPKTRCPQCRSLDGSFKKSDKDGFPVWYCRKCGVWSACRYI